MMKKLLFLISIIFIIQSCVPENDAVNTRADFIDNWTCNEYEGDFAPQTYNIEIFALGAGNRVGISGLYNQGLSFVIEAEVDGSNLFISTQTVDGLIIAGSGKLATTLNRIDLSFTVDDGSGNDFVKATCVR